MKSVLSGTDCVKKEKPFPKLMRGERTGNIYLVRLEGGTYYTTALSTGYEGDHPIGWTESSRTLHHMLRDYEGTITLSND